MHMHMRGERERAIFRDEFCFTMERKDAVEKHVLVGWNGSVLPLTA